MHATVSTEAVRSYRKALYVQYLSSHIYIHAPYSGPRAIDCDHQHIPATKQLDLYLTAQCTERIKSERKLANSKIDVPSSKRSLTTRAGGHVG
jgi:hypothetical protein